MHSVHARFNEEMLADLVTGSEGQVRMQLVKVMGKINFTASFHL